jgi:hypothetical protein
MVAKAKGTTTPANAESETFNELVASNIASLTQGLAKSSDTIDLLTRKMTSMACHIVALEALLSEVIATTGVDLVRVNSRIRSRIASQSDSLTDSEVVVDLAAAMASPPPR